MSPERIINTKEDVKSIVINAGEEQDVPMTWRVPELNG
jgi:hypothetical protein